MTYIFNSGFIEFTLRNQNKYLNREYEHFIFEKNLFFSMNHTNILKSECVFNKSFIKNNLDCIFMKFLMKIKFLQLFL